MEKQNPRVLPLKKRPVGMGGGTHDLHPREMGESPPRRGGEKTDLVTEQALKLEVQWQELLQRVRSLEVLEEPALWHEAKGLLASFGQETKTCKGSKKEWATKYTSEQSLVILPLELQSWLGECGPQTRSHAAALAETFLQRHQQSRRQGKQVAAGSSSSTIQKAQQWRQALNLDPLPEPDLPSGVSRDLASPPVGAEHMLDCKNQGESPWMLLERDEEETLSDGESPGGQGGSPKEEKTDQWIPALGGALQEPEKSTEVSRNRSPGMPCRNLNKTLLLEECSSGSNTFGCGKVHAEEDVHICSDCGKSFAGQDQLSLHQCIGEKPYKCPNCSRSFAKGSHLKSHLRTHTGEKPYQCPHCSRSFADRSNFKAHERTHTGEKPCKCPHCSKTFARGSHLNTHLRTHTGEKPYACSVCGKSFSQKANLTAHQRTHTGEKPYQCPDCGRSFATDSNLKRHRRMHTGEKPHECSECGKRFSYKQSLERHRHTHKEGNPRNALRVESALCSDVSSVA